MEAESQARRCGECQLCCKLLPVEELGKLAGQRCKYSRCGKGCTIYAHRPEGCRLWDCWWLRGEDAEGLRRPDRVHYVIDTMPDYITTTDNANPEAEPIKFVVAQVWVDPAYPDAHRDPALRAWLEKGRTIAVIRYDGKNGFILCPPSRNEEGEWLERQSQALEEPSTLEKFQVLAGLGVEFSAVVTE